MTDEEMYLHEAILRMTPEERLEYHKLKQREKELLVPREVIVKTLHYNPQTGKMEERL